MNRMTLRHVCKRYENGALAVKDFNLEVEEGEFIIFVGPSGCGKSTTLRMIAGLEDISEGELWMDGELANFLEPQQRDLSMVFQNYALYPHMNIYNNMAFGLQVRGVPKDEIDRRVKQAAGILEIEHLLDRKPAALSGGQRQRVAIGSVIVRQPRAYLMDEPLSNLDAKLRAQMRVELAKIHERLHATIIYVTHDQVEAMTLGSRIVVMKQGEVQQIAPPAELYERPVNKFVAGFIGSPSMNFMDCDVLEQKGLAWLDIAGQRVQLNERLSSALFARGYKLSKVCMGVRPEAFSTAQAGTAHNQLEMDVEVREMLGAEVLLHGSVGRYPVSVKAEPACSARPGERVRLALDLDRVHFFDPKTEENLLL